MRWKSVVGLENDRWVAGSKGKDLSCGSVMGSQTFQPSPRVCEPFFFEAIQNEVGWYSRFTNQPSTLLGVSAVYVSGFLPSILRKTDSSRRRNLDI